MGMILFTPRTWPGRFYGKRPATWIITETICIPPWSWKTKNFLLKPMNCPGHILIYKNGLHSYRELPIRYAEFGTVYRFERSGVLHGLMRVSGFTQDDAHIFAGPTKWKTKWWTF
jgi:threonyl-tRNA synthetase